MTGQLREGIDRFWLVAPLPDNQFILTDINLFFIADLHEVQCTHHRSGMLTVIFLIERCFNQCPLNGKGGRCGDALFTQCTYPVVHSRPCGILFIEVAFTK